MSSIPPFESNIPEHLLQEASPKDKWLMENISVLTQKTDWVLKETEKQSTELKEIRFQTQVTNGRLLKAEGKLKVLDEWVDDLKEIVITKRFIQKVGSSRWTWAFIGFAVMGIISIITKPELREWIKLVFFG